MNELKVTFINVGYGEAILLEEFCEGQIFRVLIDGGTNDPEEFAVSDTGRIPASKWLSIHGIHSVDVMICTHLHIDHDGGLAKLSHTLKPKVLYTPYPDHLTGVMRQLLSEDKNRFPTQSLMADSMNAYLEMLSDLSSATTVKTLSAGVNKHLSLTNHIDVQILGPLPDTVDNFVRLTSTFFQQGCQDRELFEQIEAQTNATSLVLLITYGSHKLLLQADAIDTVLEEEADFCQADLQAQLLKPGHHSQRNGTNKALIKKIKPSIGVITASSDKRWRSASEYVLSALYSAGAKLYFTDCPIVTPYTDGIHAHHSLTFTFPYQDNSWNASYEPAEK